MKTTALPVLIGTLIAAVPFSTSFAQASYAKGMTYEMAGKCIAAAHAEAKKNGWFMVTTVVDDGGHLVALGRMDNAQIASIKISQMKARAANNFRRPTKVFQDRVKDDVSVLGLPGAITSEGGIPIMMDGKIIGAVGSSGGTAQQDGVVSKACADAIGK